MAQSYFTKLAKYFADEDATRELLESMRWPNGAICPHCGSTEAYKLVARPESKSPVRPGVYKCKDCRKQFTVKVGTIFEDSHIKLNHWLYAIHAICSSKKGISAHQLHRTLGITYKSAWFMCHRIRYAMTQAPLAEMLSGVVEVDETYVGGKPRKLNQPIGTVVEQPKHARGAGTDKTPVVAAVERNGSVSAKMLTDVNSTTLQAHIHETVGSDTRIMTDGNPSYNGIEKGYISHEIVNHSAGEYARGDANTNTAESYFSLLKRGVYGTFHHISDKHLDRYVDEFNFRWNGRKISDMERTIKTVKIVGGKRLMYKQVIGE